MNHARSRLSGRRLGLLVLLSLALALGVRASQAHAAAGFIPAQNLPGTGAASGVRTAMAPNGFAVAAWVESEAGSVSAIRVSVRPPGGPWSAPQLLDARAVTARPFVAVAADAAGDAAVAWETDAGAARDTWVATREIPQQTFAPPQKLAGLSGPAVGLDSSGLVTLVGNQSGAQVARTWPVGGAPPGAGQTLGSNCSGALNQLAEAPNGDAIAGFNCSGATFAVRGPGGWGPASTPYPDAAPSCGASLSPVTRRSTGDLRVAIDAAGDPFAVALEDVRTVPCPLNLPTDTLALNLLVGAGASVQPAPAAVATGGTLTAPDLAAAAGSALVSWSTPAALPSSPPPALPGSPPALPTQSDQHVRSFDAHGTPVGPAQLVGQSALSARGVLGLSQSGYALDLFPRPDGSVVGAFRAPRAAFGPAVTLGAAARAPSAAIDDAGDGLAGFVAGSGAAARATIRGFDATAPQLTLAAIPKRATAGIPAAFSASAHDFWGPVGVLWNFGDGSTGRGASVRHVFAAAGHLTVTAVAFDAVGNAVSAAAAVGVGRSVPVLSHIFETHSRFRVGSARTAISAARRSHRTAVGTTFGFTLSVDAAVAVRIDHTAAGLVSRHHCVAPSRRVRASSHPRCTRIVVDGTLRRHGHRGGNRVRFSGRIGRRALGRGAHRVTIGATVGGASGRSRHLNFVIVP
jgi:hypothetical protein